MKRVKTGITKKRDADIITPVSNMVAAATGKPEFAACPISPADLGTLVNTASNALTAETQAADALGLRQTERKMAFQAVRDGVAQFADFARSTYKGDKALLQAVALDVIEPFPLGVLPAPQNLRGKLGKLDGTIDVFWKSVAGRDFYTLECAPAATGPWTEDYKGKAGRATCSGLTSGSEYFFRVRAWGAAGPGAWSDISKKRAA